MPKFHCFCRGLAVVALTAAMAAAPAWAANSTGATHLGSVTTTATRVAAPSYNVPATISSVSGKQIREDHMGINFSESVQGIPGLLARSRQNYAQDEQVSIRGFGARTTFGVRGIRLYIDGIPASFPDGQGQVSNFDLSNADRIEVLRGPFSALYGNSSGGVIQIFTQNGHKPDSVGGGIAWGSYHSLRADLNANGKIGKLDYNADFTHFHTGGFRDHSAARREIFQSKLTYHFDKQTSLTAVLNNFSGPEALDPGALSRADWEANPRQTYKSALAFDTRKSVEQHLGGLILKHDFGNGQKLRLMGYYGARQVKQFIPIPTAAQKAAGSAGSVIDLHDLYGGADARWTWKTQLLNQPFTLIAGLAFDRENERRKGYNNFTGPNFGSFAKAAACPSGDICGVQGDLRRNELDNEYDFAQYLQLRWDIARRWVVMAGVRRNKVNFRSHDYFIRPGNGNGSGSRSYYNTTPVAGLMYKAASWAHVYADFGSGFQTPTFAELAYSTSGAGLNLGLSAAKTENSQLGVKLQLPYNTNAEIALFHALTRNEIVVNTNSNGRSTYTNAGRVRRQGLEFSARHAFQPWLRGQLAYTYLDATVRNAYTTNGATVNKGARLPGVPESRLFAALRFGHDTGLHVGIDAQYLSDVTVNDQNSEAAPAYGLIDTSIGYTFDRPHYTLTAFARFNNIMDVDYVGSVVVNASGGRYYETGPGRNFLVGLNWRWKD